MAELKRVYFVHHSHTDIGYTDAQEVIISLQVEFIKNALKINKNVASEYLKEIDKSELNRLRLLYKKER